LFVIGAVVAGSQSGRIFIETALPQRVVIQEIERRNAKTITVRQ
jgi:hypothetical protein